MESLENSAFTAYNSPAAANDAEGSRHKASEAAETPATVTSATVPQNPGVVSRVNWHSPFAASPADSPGHNLHQSANTYSTPPVALPDTGGVLQGSYHGPAPGLGFQSTVSIPHGLGPLLQPISEPSPRLYLDQPLWPLNLREEARLLRHFIERIAPNMDLTDPFNHFATVVPQRAATCPPLLNAVLASSARHLSSISDYDPVVANRYHQQCLKYLIPMLDDTAAILDENLLASTVILRFLEEIEVPVSGQTRPESQHHLLGTHAFLTAQERSSATGGLRQAAFFCGLRQEIYVAFVNQRSILPALEFFNIDRSLNPTDNHTWANR